MDEWCEGWSLVTGSQSDREVLKHCLVLSVLSWLVATLFLMIVTDCYFPLPGQIGHDKVGV